MQKEVKKTGNYSAARWMASRCPLQGPHEPIHGAWLSPSRRQTPLKWAPRGHHKNWRQAHESGGIDALIQPVDFTHMIDPVAGSARRNRSVFQCVFPDHEPLRVSSRSAFCSVLIRLSRS